MRAGEEVASFLRPSRAGMWASARGLLRVLLLLQARLVTSGPCSAGRASSEVCELSDSVTMEYELRWAHGWQWFVLPTNNVAAVAAGLVLQRGSSKNFPRTGFVMMASSSGVPPGTLMGSDYDPLTYEHDDPVGARRQFIYEAPGTGIRPNTDWKVLTIGIDANVSASRPELVQVRR